MKKTLLLLILCASSTFAQTANRISLTLGTVNVWLGEDKITVKQQTEQAGMTFHEFSSKDGHEKVIVFDSSSLHTLEFEGGKLTYAERNWLSNESNALPSVIDALASLVDKGATNCTIEHEPLSSPEQKLDRVFISCGPRGIYLLFGTLTVAGKPSTDNAIMERIGTFRLY